MEEETTTREPLLVAASKSKGGLWTLPFIIVRKLREIPAGSFGTFTLITITVWIAFYDRLILPLASKLTGKPNRLGLKTRMGIGLSLSRSHQCPCQHLPRDIEGRALPTIKNQLPVGLQAPSLQEPCQHYGWFRSTACDSVTSRSGNISWVSSNINEGHYDYYYWLLAALSLFNCLYFLLCCWAYNPCEGQLKKAPNDVV